MSYSVYKQTVDDFHRSFQLFDRDTQLVRVRFHGNISPPTRRENFRVSVFGNDDMGYVYDSNSRDLAELAFKKVIELPEITFKRLEELDFTLF